MASSDSSEFISVDLLTKNSPDVFLDVSELLLRFADNIIKNPSSEKYRKIRVANPIVQKRLLPVEGAIECLFEMGFEEVSMPPSTMGILFSGCPSDRTYICACVFVCLCLSTG